MQINVGLRHIANGKPLDPFDCPIALAVKDIGCIDVTVQGEWLFFLSLIHI